jgi:hypothetical protein
VSASYTYVISTGTIAIDTTDLLSDVETEWKNAFGATLNTDASTPQGTLIASETTARTSVMKNNAELANMQNPNLAYGVYLDATCALLGIGRGTNKSTVASGVQITGDVDTVIPAGSRISTPNNDIFSLVTAVTIPVGGVTTGTFQSQEYGAFAFPTGTMTILDGTIGWGSADAVVGTTVISGSTQNTDPQLKNKRNAQLAIQGTASTAAIMANLLEVPNVTSAMVVENNTGSPGVVNGITFTKATGMWVCVAGTPDQSAVAAALYAAHNGGCPWDYGAAGMGVPVNSPNGVTTPDPSTGLPQVVLYNTPVLYDTYVHLIVQQSASQSPGSAAIQGAVMTYAQGLESNEPGFVMGADVSAFEVSGSIARQYPGLYVKSCMVACVPAGSPAPSYPSGYTYEFVIAPYQQAQLAIGNINVSLV